MQRLQTLYIEHECYGMSTFFSSEYNPSTWWNYISSYACPFQWWPPIMLKMPPVHSSLLTPTDVTDTCLGCWKVCRIWLELPMEPHQVKFHIIIFIIIAIYYLVYNKHCLQFSPNFATRLFLSSNYFYSHWWQHPCPRWEWWTVQSFWTITNPYGLIHRRTSVILNKY